MSLPRELSDNALLLRLAIESPESPLSALGRDEGEVIGCFLLRLEIEERVNAALEGGDWYVDRAKATLVSRVEEGEKVTPTWVGDALSLMREQSPPRNYNYHSYPFMTTDRVLLVPAHFWRRYFTPLVKTELALRKVGSAMRDLTVTCLWYFRTVSFFLITALWFVEEYSLFPHLPYYLQMSLQALLLFVSLLFDAIFFCTPCFALMPLLNLASYCVGILTFSTIHAPTISQCPYIPFPFLRLSVNGTLM
jgi:hypothetical protein